MDGILIGAILALLLRGPRRGALAADMLQWLFLPAAIAVLCNQCALLPAPDSRWLLTIGYSADCAGERWADRYGVAAGFASLPIARPAAVADAGQVTAMGFTSITCSVGRLGLALLTLVLAPRLHSQVLGNVIALIGSNCGNVRWWPC